MNELQFTPREISCMSGLEFFTDYEVNGTKDPSLCRGFGVFLNPSITPVQIKRILIDIRSKFQKIHVSILHENPSRLCAYGSPYYGVDFVGRIIALHLHTIGGTGNQIDRLIANLKRIKGVEDTAEYFSMCA